MASEKISDIVDPKAIEQVNELIAKFKELEGIEQSMSSLKIAKLNAISAYIAANNNDLGFAMGNTSIKSAQDKAEEIIKSL